MVKIFSRFQTKTDQTHTAWMGDTCISYIRKYLFSWAGENIVSAKHKEDNPQTKKASPNDDTLPPVQPPGLSEKSSIEMSD